MTAAKLLFAGTPDFALESLRALHQSGLAPVAVLTQPDRPSGRGKKLTASPVKQFAAAEGIPVWQPETLKAAGSVARIAAIEPDLIVVAAYGLLLPQAVLSIPRRGCVNVHASLLPRWRGAAPIQAAIAHGDSQTGISLMQMDAGLDTGPVLASAAIDIEAQETAGSLHDRLAALGGELLVQKLAEVLEGSVAAIPQDNSLATYAGKIRTPDAAIDWQLSAGQIERNVRAYDPVPGASFALDGETIKCWKAEAVDGREGPAGTVLAAGKRGVLVACAEGALRLLEVQRPGRRRVTAAEFAGQGNLAGRRLG
jgi:methionyl-tRNA formyltransferase